MAVKAPIGALSLAASVSSSSRVFLSARSSVNFSLLRTSFFNGGVGSLKATVIQPTVSKRHRCGWHGGGALGAQMNLFDRIARVIMSYVNAIVSNFEDPEKILEQSLHEMNDGLRKLHEAAAQVVGSQKQIDKKYKAAQRASDDWYHRAKLALANGEEDSAHEALSRRKYYADNANALKVQLDQQKSIVQNLEYRTQLLERKVEEAKSKKDTLIALALSAKTATTVNEMLGNVHTSSALSAFEKMEEKVLAMESRADAVFRLTTDDLKGKFALLESSTDGDLVKLKKEFSESLKGELPSNKKKRKKKKKGELRVSSTNASFPSKPWILRRHSISTLD